MGINSARMVTDRCLYDAFQTITPLDAHSPICASGYRDCRRTWQRTGTETRTSTFRWRGARRSLSAQTTSLAGVKISCEFGSAATARRGARSWRRRSRGSRRLRSGVGWSSGPLRRVDRYLSCELVIRTASTGWRLREPRAVLEEADTRDTWVQEVTLHR